MVPAKPTSLTVSDLKSTEISFYKNCRDKGSSFSNMFQALELIKTGDGFKQRIDELRAVTSQESRDRLKAQLPAITVSGLFGVNRRAMELKQHSGFLQIDIDKPDSRLALKEKLKIDPYSFAVFDSPTKTGLKIIVRIEANAKTHKRSFMQLRDYYLEKFAVKIDEKCSDVSRLMFLSFDEDLYVNYDALQWQNAVDEKQDFENMLKWLNVKGNTFSEGSRNDFVYKLSAACFRIKVPQDYTALECIRRFESESFSRHEIEDTVRSAYKSSKEHTQASKGESDSKPEKQKSFSQLARVENYLNSKYELRLNEITLDVEYKLLKDESAFAVLNENSIFRELQLQNISISITKLTSLFASDFVSPYNPFTTYFEALAPWDNTQIDFIERLCSYLPIKDSERFKRQFKKMLVRCVACSLNDNVFNKQAFIFVHSEQNSGKSTFCRWLCPPALQKYYAENISVDKDSLIALTQNFLINLDELATLSRTEINALKSMFSKDKVKVRAPYERKPVTKPRRASFIGSTNKDEFLTDETGSVRFLCFELTDRIDFRYKTEVAIDNIWRQAFALYKGGFNYELTLDEVRENEQANRKHQIITAEMELIQSKYLPASKGANNAEFMTATDIQKAIIIDNLAVRVSAPAIGRALKLLGFQKVNEYKEQTKYTIKGYYVTKLSSD
ncbi:MAG: VapE family protein [Chitinophagales bacterium]